jgi:hypothetical protein
MTSLRKSGYLDESGDTKKLTEEGRKASAAVSAMPRGAALLKFYRKEIGEGAPRQIFEVLVKAGGRPIARDELGTHAGVDPAKSTFRNAMTVLRSWDIVDVGEKGKAIALSAEVSEALAMAGAAA